MVGLPHDLVTGGRMLNLRLLSVFCGEAGRTSAVLDVNFWPQPLLFWYVFARLHHAISE